MQEHLYHDLGSSQFLALMLLRDRLKAGLGECIEANITQYRCPVRAYELGGAARSKTLAAQFKLAPNVIAQSSNALEQAGLSLVDWRILQAISERGAGMLIGELSTALSMPSNTVTCSADRLEARSLVRRTKNAGNLRTVALEITGRGTKVVKRSRRALNEFAQNNLWKRLTEDQIETAYLGGLELAKLYVMK